MLHITNGDSAADLIREAGVAGDVLPWRDVLHEGPVPAGLSLDELRDVRAKFLADVAWDTYETALKIFEQRDATLIAFREHEEVILWFEHDLYDQLQLIQLLAFFAEQELGSLSLSLIQAHTYLGSGTPARMRELFEARHEVSASELDAGRKAWSAFGSADPTEIVALLENGTEALPHLAAALHRHLEQFPSTINGLSRSERQALEVIASGATRLRDAFTKSQAREERLFLGDSVFAWYLAQLSEGTRPLVTEAEGGPISMPGDDAAEQRAFWNRHVTLTPLGRVVLKGDMDRIAVRGIDRWLGGVHLSGREIEWRWDPYVQRLRPRAADDVRE